VAFTTGEIVMQSDGTPWRPLGHVEDGHHRIHRRSQPAQAWQVPPWQSSADFHPDRIAETKPDYVFMLPWNLEREIPRQMKPVREWGGRFVVPIPRVRVSAGLASLIPNNTIGLHRQLAQVTRTLIRTDHAQRMQRRV
jgi:hypothetical protein